MVSGLEVSGVLHWLEFAFQIDQRLVLHLLSPHGEAAISVRTSGLYGAHLSELIVSASNFSPGARQHTSIPKDPPPSASLVSKLNVCPYLAKFL